VSAAGPARRDRRRRGERDPEGRRRYPEALATVVGSVFDKMGITARVERAAVAAAWHDLVGPHIAGVTGEVKLRGSTLFVEVHGAAWLTELDMMKRRLLATLNEGRRGAKIEKIVFLQSDGSRASGSAGHGRRGRRGA